MNKSMIPVFFCTDNNYAVPTYIAIYSMLKNYSGHSKVNVYILVPDNFNDKNTELLESLSGKCDCLELKIIRMDDCYDKVSINSKHVSTSTLYRLMIPRLANQINKDQLSEDRQIEKCIYLDSDIVVEGNIAELYDINVDGYYAAGVRDRAVSNEEFSNFKELIKLKESLGIPTLRDYINAGVLLLNIKEINEVSEELEQAGHRNDYRYNDQDVINSICYGRIKLLSLKFNAMTTCLNHNDQSFYQQYGKSNIQEARENPVILHYILKNKPWSCRTMIKAGNWWRYIKMQDEYTLREYIRPFLISHKAPLKDRFRETAKTAAVYLRVYNIIRNIHYSLRK